MNIIFYEETAKKRVLSSVKDIILLCFLRLFFLFFFIYFLLLIKPNHMCNGFSQAVAPSDKVGKKKENPQKIPQTSFE
jgi:hypothetical protein